MKEKRVPTNKQEVLTYTLLSWSIINKVAIIRNAGSVYRPRTIPANTNQTSDNFNVIERRIFILNTRLNAFVNNSGLKIVFFHYFLNLFDQVLQFSLSLKSVIPPLCN